MRRAAQNNCPTGKKQQQRKIITAEPVNTTSEKSKNKCRTGKQQLLNNKKQLPNQQNPTAEISKNNCRKIKKQLPKQQNTTAQNKTDKI